MKPGHRPQVVVAASSGGVTSAGSHALATTLLQCSCGQEMGSRHKQGPGGRLHGAITNKGEVLLSKPGEEKGTGGGWGEESAVCRAHGLRWRGRAQSRKGRAGDFRSVRQTGWGV